MHYLIQLHGAHSKVFYILILAWRLFPFKSKGYQFVYPSLIILLFIYAALSKCRHNLNLAVLSVGHGQCIVLSCEGENVIIDAGSITKSNIGDKIVNPYLDYLAVRKISAVYISHDDIDHFNGLPEITNKHIVNNFFAAPQLIASSSDAAGRLKSLYKLAPAPETLLCGRAVITRLWPVETSANASDNDLSLVLLVQYRGVKVLFCSDITADVQRKLITLYPMMDIDILVSPHHGSMRTTDELFIGYFKPEYIITSSAERALSPAIIKVENNFCTFRDGAINVIVDADSRISVNSFKKLQ